MVDVLGDLPEEDAKRFFFGDAFVDAAAGTAVDPAAVHAAASASAAADGAPAPAGDKKPCWAGIINDASVAKELRDTAETHWKEIYERCSGNIGLLKEFVSLASQTGSWDDAVDDVIKPAREKIEEGFTPGSLLKRDEPPLWTAKQWGKVLERIATAAPYHAVLKKKLVAELGQGDEERGDKILMSLVKYNLLALRPHSSLVRDLPETVHGDDEEDVVTLMSPAHVWAAKEILVEKKE